MLCWSIFLTKSRKKVKITHIANLENRHKKIKKNRQKNVFFLIFSNKIRLYRKLQIISLSLKKNPLLNTKFRIIRKIQNTQRHILLRFQYNLLAINNKKPIPFTKLAFNVNFLNKYRENSIIFNLKLLQNAHIVFKINIFFFNFEQKNIPLFNHNRAHSGIALYLHNI